MTLTSEAPPSSLAPAPERGERTGKHPGPDSEEWRPVKDFPEYEVSSLGRLRRGDLVRKTPPSKNGYCALGLWRDGRAHTRNMHRLVAEAFLPNPTNLPVVMHLNDVRHDNRVSNLRWATQSENLKAAGRKGAMTRSPLTLEQVERIKADPAPATQLAEELGVTAYTIRAIRKGTSWCWTN